MIIIKTTWRTWIWINNSYSYTLMKELLWIINILIITKNKIRMKMRLKYELTHWNGIDNGVYDKKLPGCK